MKKNRLFLILLLIGVLMGVGQAYLQTSKEIFIGYSEDICASLDGCCPESKTPQGCPRVERIEYRGFPVRENIDNASIAPLLVNALIFSLGVPLAGMLASQMLTQRQRNKQ
jgi:hypothetical protein